MNIKLSYFFIIIIVNLNSIISYSPPESENASLETYKLNEFPERQNIIKFMKANLIISYHCVIQKNGKNFRRECGAWKPLDILESGKYKKYFTPNKVLPDPKNLRSVSFFICQQTGGSITSEVNEFGGGRDATPLDFCQFKDNSLLALITLEKFIQGIPNFTQTISFD